MSVDFNSTESIMDSDLVDNDVHVKLQESLEKIQQLKDEKLSMEKSYNAQRANFQNLYIKKEEEVKRLSGELEETKNELVIAQLNEDRLKDDIIRKQQEQLAELQQLVGDTLDESCSSQTQMRSLQKAISTLEEQLAKHKAEKSESLLLAPSTMISATKSFAKKVVSQLGTDLDKSTDADLEDSMAKAQQEAELIRSLVVPLEQTIKDLEKKLRSAETRLRQYDITINSSSNGGVSEAPCHMCANYESQLQAEQQLKAKIQKENRLLEEYMEKFKDDLAKETQFRKQMEEKWNDKKEEQKLQVAQLKTEVLAGKLELEELQTTFATTCHASRTKLQQLSFERGKIHEEMRQLVRKNEELVGKYNKHSEELKAQDINLPNTVEELQECVMRLTEDLIGAMVAKEWKEKKEQTLMQEVELLQGQFSLEKNQWSEKERAYAHEIYLMKEQSNELTRERSRLISEIEVLKNKERLLENELKDQLVKLQIEHDGEKQDLQASVTSLNNSLAASEETVREYVRLSQGLQIQMEEFRGVDREVRWQDPSDYDVCHGCHMNIRKPSQKVHCRHCCKIFCDSCLKKTVMGGPTRSREMRVCDVCHTLLVKDTAPYYSQEPPPSPD